ncbi:bifunctional 4-hydroxy-2-oxoglutarate aldolase/2-dehydro-3-deoxy-phosphogluconate aldolase [Grimontia sp. NTOU-MAR1]|uniref:bifunctional 4-hydroxy-2-oxoglutarate aldolase/2-dehydro-3-deoxy-phosphogluconate aldolase n=1 Tax=Grimontia sp. NTOU-MAR1 TaxID=3111011 RepID=UPI002DBBCDCE|nr:bifunctional 4-hydroxy-2-oxoglutarate aldolase/2-dehydro-3-deoxy-phosphogluconate aldolase [Grimontia sp. NTOU-MAR1]WRW00675.1 bifunctional 4-hydroxy-2-oxoglutarate aldolase/2-dehydro-3-deoxy-phosphogluconate aldolase [Grimontia sp. NTOU-MAR1]
MSTTIFNELAKYKVVPVIQIDDIKHAAPLAKALVENGLPVAEVTFRTDAAAEAIKIMRESQSDLLVGAGTVLTAKQADDALAAGAMFAVAPGLNPNTVKHCKEIGLPMVSGVNNPSQIEQALELGMNFVKFFPAEASGGVAMVKALLAPYRDIQMMPTGGISPKNVKDYLSIDRVVCCGGTWMVPGSLMKEGDWDGLGKLISEAVALVE